MNLVDLEKKRYLILQSQKKGGDSVNGEVIAGGDEFLLNISLINVDVSYVISATKIEPTTFSDKTSKRFETFLLRSKPTLSI